MDIRIIEINIEKQLLSFVHHGKNTFDDVKNELARIGHPIIQCSNTVSKTKKVLRTGPRGQKSTRRGRPRYTIHQ